MRLIRRKIYRAFPELDRFDDDQCRRFVHAANSSWLRRIGRWAAVGLTTTVMVVGGLIGAVVLAEWLDNKMVSAGTIGFIGWGVLLVLGSGLGLFAGLVLRDRILRLRVRQLIRRCGSCPTCHYSLLGMRVGADHVIVCPECATKVIADPAMGELTTDETGAAVYKPEVVRIDALAKAARRKRHRRFIKWAAVSAAAAVLLLVAGVGTWWMMLTSQAARARAERDTIERVRALQVKMLPEESMDGEAEFERYRAMIAPAAAMTHLPLGPEEQPQVALAFDASTLREDADATAYDKRGGSGMFAACRAYTIRGLEQARKDGISEKLRGLMELRRPMRTMAPPPSEPFVMVTAMDLGEARGMARLNLARMIDAKHHGDRQEYVEAAEETLTAAGIAERQGLLIDRLVGTAMRSLVYRQWTEDAGKFADEKWLEDVLGVMDRRGGRPPLSASFEMERVGGLDTLQWFFGDPAKVAKSQFGYANPALFSGGWGPMSGAVGTYDANKAAWNTMYSAYTAAAAVSDPNKRPPIPTAPTGLAMIATLTPALGKMFQSDDQLRYEQRRCIVTLGAELYRKRMGKPPESADDVAGLLKDPEGVIDPASGKPFRFIVKDASGKDGKPFEIRDGEADEPKPWEPKPASPPTKPGAVKPGKTK
jgi:hypothetical protein